MNGAPLLYHTIARAKEARLIDDAIVLSPQPLDLPEGIFNFVYESGNENDVLSRYYKCLQKKPADYIVRLTADCPILDSSLIDFVIAEGLKKSADYASNVIKLTFPDGVDCELIRAEILQFLDMHVVAPYHREHVTSILRDSPQYQDRFSMVSVESEQDYSRLKWSVDVPEDLERLKNMEAEFFK